MRIFCISDHLDTLTGMRLAGIKGTLVQSREEALETLAVTRKDKDIGILLITEKTAALIREELEAIQEESPLPLIIEIPDATGSQKDENYILNYVKESIGIKL